MAFLIIPDADDIIDEFIEELEDLDDTSDDVE